jgi:anti-sigma regulatory factor (Ser/Thr protein kinase)
MQQAAPRVREQVLSGFEPALEAPHAARRFVAEVLRERGDIELIGDASLIVSELATNAVVHACCRFEVAVQFEPGTVALSVSDSSAELPAIRDPSPADPHGRGLLVVEALARRWGWVQTRAGKRVWAELTSASP